MKTFLSLCLLFLAASVASGFQTSDWVKFNSAPGNFSISLPKQPAEEKKTTPSPYPSYTSTFYTVQGNAEMYIVGWVDYEPSFVFNPDKELEANRDNMVKGVKGTLLASKKISLGNYQGLDFTGQFFVEKSQFLFKAQVFIVGKRPYMLSYIFLQGNESIPNRNRFFSTFQIKPKA